jgi:hypothetical protein
VRSGVAEVDEEAVAKVLRGVPTEVLDDASRCLLVRADEFAEFFGIQGLRNR